MRLDKLSKTVVSALEDIKGRDIVVLDVRRITPMFDKLVIVTGDSARQNKALANNVQEKVKATGKAVYSVEGVENGEWVLVDLGAVIVHIMQSAVRQYYNLEELWGGLKEATAPRREAVPRRTRRPRAKA